MTQFKAWSYSALDAWETCPKRYFHTRIKRDWPDEKNEAALWGDTVHKALEARMKHGTPLPSWGTNFEPLVAKVMAAQGKGWTVQVEHKVAINASFQPTEFFAKDTWCRAVADVNVMAPKAMMTLDWKTGKFKQTTDQLRLSAAMQFAHYPHIDSVTIQYAWLKENKTTTEKFHREQAVEIWRDFLPRVERMRAGFEKDDWTPKPSGLCRQYCPVLSCEFNGRRK